MEVSLRSAASIRSNLLPQRTQERLAGEGIGQRVERVGPFVARPAALGRLARLPVPADLLHVVVELDGVAVGVDGERRIVDPGRQLGRQADDLDAVFLEEPDGGPELGIIADLHAEGHAGRVLAQAQLGPERDRIERERVVLGVDAQERAAVPVPADFLGHRHAEPVAVEGERRVEVVREQPHRPDPHRLERPGQQDAAHVVGRFEGLLVPVAGRDVGPVRPRPVDLGVFGDLRQSRLLVEFLFVQRAGLGSPVPADLLDPVIELVDVLVGIEGINVPVRPRRVAAGPPDPDVALAQPVLGLGDLAQAADLPGDLVDRHVLARRSPADMVEDGLGEQHEGMVVAAVAHEPAGCRIEFPGVFLVLQTGAEIERIGEREAEQVGIEPHAGVDVPDVEAEMAEPADLERPVEQDTADVDFRAVVPSIAILPVAGPF